MAEVICRLGTPAGEIVTRTIEASAVHEARARLEREGFKVFNITPPKVEGATSFTKISGGSGRTKVKANDFLLFNQQLAALLRAGDNEAAVRILSQNDPQVMALGAANARSIALLRARRLSVFSDRPNADRLAAF